MDREEAIQVLQTALTAPFIYGNYADALDMAIEALSAKTDGDLISRKGAIGALCTMMADCFNADEEVIDAIKTTMNEISSAEAQWIPCSERLPKEHEWIGTKAFGTTISDEVLVTFDVDGTRFVKPLSLQNGKLSRPDAQTMDAFHKGWKMLAWMSLPEPYRKDNE